MNEPDPFDVIDGDSPPNSELSGNSGSGLANFEKKPSFNKRREFRKMDSMGSNTSEALDFLADMCVEIDEIESALAPSPPPDLAAPGRRTYGQNSGSNIFKSPSPRGSAQYFKKKSSDSSLGDGSLGPLPELHHPHTIQVKVVDFGNRQIHLIPSNDADIDVILSLTKESAPFSLVNISLEKGDPSKYAIKNSGKAGAGSKLINPKHIYKTACDTYRVQMSKGSKTNPNGKFSRNTRSELDALWLCEFALILIDRPTGFDDILVNGNFKCFLQRGIVSSPEDFADKLHMHMADLSSRGLLKPAECEKLKPLVEKHIPQHYPFNDPRQQQPSSAAFWEGGEAPGKNMARPVVTPGGIGFSYAAAPPSKGAGSKIMEKAKGSIAGIGSMLSTQWGSFSDLERKKRRRTPQTLQQQQSGEISNAESGDDAETVGNWLMSGQPPQDPALSQLTSQFVKNRYDSRRGALPTIASTDSGEFHEEVMPYEEGPGDML